MLFKLVSVPILCLLLMRVAEVQSVETCKNSSDCPADKFCDLVARGLCARCDDEVCDQTREGWEETCSYNCPRYYEMLKTTTGPPAATKPNNMAYSTTDQDDITAGIQENHEKHSWSAKPYILIPVVVGAPVLTVILGLLIPKVIHCERNRRRRNIAAKHRSEAKQPVMQDNTPHDRNRAESTPMMITQV